LALRPFVLFRFVFQQHGTKSGIKGACHLAKKNPEISVEFRNIRAEIVDYIHSLFSSRIGTAECSLQFATVFSFQSPVSQKQKRSIT